MTNILTNSAALKSLYYLQKNDGAATEATERLASGKRINKAGDDAAGAAQPARSGSEMGQVPTVPRLVLRGRRELPEGPVGAGARFVHERHRGQFAAGVRVPGGQRRADRELVRRSERQAAAQAHAAARQAGAGAGRATGAPEEVCARREDRARG